MNTSMPTSPTPSLPYIIHDSSLGTRTPIAQEIQITSSDIMIGGVCLLPLSIIFVFVNGFLCLAVYRDWATIRGSRHFSYYLLTLMLTVADLMFGLLVGVPAGIHLTWMSYFRKQEAMRFYSRIIGYLLFEYIFLLRIVIIAALSVDGCCQLMFPVRYVKGIITNARAKFALVVIMILPLVMRSIPNIVHLWITNLSVICLSYKDPTISVFERVLNYENFSVPLTCALEIGGTKSVPVSENVDAFSTVELVLLASITIIAWLIIFVTNVINLIQVFRFTFLNSIQAQWQSITAKEYKTFVKACLLVIGITVSFTLASVPYTWIWCADYSFRADLQYETVPLDNQQRFYLTLLTFLSLAFHPWLYVLQLDTIRNLISRFMSNSDSDWLATEQLRPLQNNL